VFVHLQTVLLTPPVVWLTSPPIYVRPRRPVAPGKLSAFLTSDPEAKTFPRELEDKSIFVFRENGDQVSPLALAVISGLLP